MIASLRSAQRRQLSSVIRITDYEIFGKWIPPGVRPSRVAFRVAPARCRSLDRGRRASTYQLSRPPPLLLRKNRAVSIARHLAQLLRFMAVGAIGFAVGLLVLTGLHGLAGVNYLVAYIASFFAANAAGYLLNAYFTFSARSVNHAGAARYMIINAVMLCVNTVALKLLVERAHIWYVTAAIILAIAATPVTFLAHRLVTYRLQTRSRAGTCRRSHPVDGPQRAGETGRAK